MQELFLFCYLSLHVGLLQTTCFFPSCSFINWNSSSDPLCNLSDDVTNGRMLLVHWESRFITTWVHVLVFHQVISFISLDLAVVSRVTQNPLRHSCILLCLFQLWLTIAFSPPPLFVSFSKASLSTWSFPRDIWHDDTGVWQVTSLETQRHEEKSKTLLISL